MLNNYLPTDYQNFIALSRYARWKEDEYVRKKLEDKADAFDDVAFTPEKKKAKVVDKHDNVVVLSFDADTDGNA